MTALQQKFAAAVAAYTGRQCDAVQVVPDPQVRGTYAVRAVVGARELHFLLEGGRIHADALEECEFTGWPPVSRHDSMEVQHG